MLKIITLYHPLLLKFNSSLESIHGHNISGKSYGSETRQGVEFGGFVFILFSENWSSIISECDG